jgi:leucyl aminopeptidase
MSGMAVFYDLGDTLVIPVVTESGVLQTLTVLPLVPEALTRMRSMATDAIPIRLGVISNTGDEKPERMRQLLVQSGLFELFDPELLLFSSAEHMDKTKPDFFRLAAARAGLDPASCLFVGESEAERKVAGQGGLRVSFHPLHAFHVAGLMMQNV